MKRLITPAALSAALLIGVLSSLVTLAELGQPFAGFLPAWRPPGIWAVDNGTPPWWPALATHDLRTTDTLLALDGQPLDQSQSVLSRAADSQRDRLPLVVLRDGQPQTLSVPVLRYTMGRALEVKAAEIVNGVTLWLIGLLIFRTRPHDPLNRSAALACALFSLNQWLWHAALVDARVTGAALLNIVWVIATPLIGPALLHFGLRFVQRDPSGPLPRAASALRAAGWISGAALSIALLLTRMLNWPAENGHLQALLYRATVLSAFGGVLGVIALLLANLATRRAQTTRTRQQRAVIATGFLVALPALLVHLTALLRGNGSFYVLGGLDLRAFYLAVPLALSLAILRYQTFKSELPLQLGVATAAASAMLASVGDWVVRALTPVEAGFLLPPFVIIFLLLFGAFAGYQVLSHRSMPRVFRWQSTNYAAARRIGELLAAHSDPARLPERIVLTLAQEMQLERVALWLRDEQDGSYVLVAAVPRQYSCGTPEPETILKLEGMTGMPLRLPMNHDALEAAVCLRGFDGAQPQGILALGKRTDEEIFHERDFEVVALIAQQIALRIATARQMHALRQVPLRVAQAQEQERFRIAQELHDTVQQYLGRLPFQIEASRGLIASNPDAAQSKLGQIIDDVAGAARTVREIRSHLAPLQLQRGFAAPARDLLNRFGARTGLQVDARIDDAVDALMPVQARHALFRILQQALDNIETHAGASRVLVTIAPADDARVQFLIEDDGRGFDASRPAQAEADGHLGLHSMHARMAALGGQLHVAASPGAGTRLHGWLPAS